ncbi:hypothetical protein DIT68_00425 [Brumimicrobium oceani]|uniref:EF-hand domain-containing protein n=1 Tax=Brumimicrobium oceani TaxID=2100725 RepID=A0A2U2XG47_9FLAO|nr:hypothetical protein DIT68_00425 [Brumimicrobium oceani]
MHQCYFLLQIYDDFIYGDLAPPNLDNKNKKLIINHLESTFSSCEDLEIIKVKFLKNRFEVVEKVSISNAHPLKKDYFSQENINFENDLDEVIIQKILDELSPKTDNIQFTISKSEKNIQSIGVCRNSSWNEINYDRSKYCYYYQVLKKSSFDLKSRIKLLDFELDEIDFKKLITKVQKTLMLYLKELSKTYTIKNNLLSFRVKSSYNNQDYFLLIYSSIINLLNYLYENYHIQINKTFQVPYYSEIINENKFDHKIKIIKKHLKNEKVNLTLINIIEHQLNRITDIDNENRLTYHELDYFIKYINGLTNHFLIYEKRKNTTEDIIFLLISNRFNNLKFIKFITDEIRLQLESTINGNDKRTYLLDKRNAIIQCFPTIDLTYDPKSKEIDQVLLEWIEIELENIIKHIEINNQTVNEENILKLKTTLSVPEVSVLLKTLNDSGIVSSESYSELARIGSNCLRTENTENISTSQLRNYFYDKDPVVIESIKTRLIQALNNINKNLD